MTIHVSIQEADKRLSELIQAVRRGEEVVIEEEGEGPIHLVAVPPPGTFGSRDNVFGIWRDAFEGYDTSLAALKAGHEDPDERFRRKFGLPD